ncbi:hypothetical protein [Paraburkholderia franconis]|uniref:hypothetical protein n=1 Tax=Paraburkholderia franconis TaxID=2654983 RepID=UPI0038995E39
MNFLSPSIDFARRSNILLIETMNGRISVGTADVRRPHDDGLSELGRTCRLDPAVIVQLAPDVKDARLRREVTALCKESAHADRHLSEGEDMFVRVLRAAWRMPRENESPQRSRKMSKLVSVTAV